MSALPPKADIRQRGWDVRFVPMQTWLEKRSFALATSEKLAAPTSARYSMTASAPGATFASHGGSPACARASDRRARSSACFHLNRPST
jgi:hypothetical protein